MSHAWSHLGATCIQSCKQLKSKDALGAHAEGEEGQGREDRGEGRGDGGG
jgi:hypothetical protein